jgi:hypothetical protein
MKLFLSLLLVTTFLESRVQAYPRITNWRNEPLIVFEGDKHAVLKKDQELKSPFFALTSRLDEVTLSLNTGSSVEVAKNTKLQVFEVFEDLQQEHILFLFDGTIRLKNERSAHAKKEIKPNRIRTPFFDLDQPMNADVIIYQNMKEPSVEIRMVRGEWNLEFFSYEKKLTLKSGQQVKFTGQLADEPDQIKYDYLLEDKKIPKGHLGDVQKFNLAQFIAEKKVADADLIKKEKLEKKKIQDALNKKKKHEASFLCKNPFANLNQCAWILEGDKCFRQRCNAGGTWGDKTERPVTQACTKDFLVGSCDY